MGPLLNGLFRRKLKILRQSDKANFEVYLKGKLKNFWSSDQNFQFGVK